MIIDIHTHITYEHFPSFSKGLGRKPFTVRTLLKHMDMEGIDRSALLPIVNPENMGYFAMADNQECLRACRRYPDRLMTFCNIDPRAMLNTPKADLSQLMKIYKDLGCLGIGEVCANLPVAHPLYKNLFYHAGCEGLPVLFHLTGKRRGVYGMIDRMHLPGLEEVLKEFPDTVFIGHAMAFWNEIDGNLRAKDREGYPKTSIRKRGRLWYLLRKYPNLYADISAGSGYNGLSRDQEVGYRFLKEFNRNIFFGTDRFASGHEPVPPVLAFLRNALKNGKITKNVYENVMHRNFERVILGGKRGRVKV